MQAKAWRRIGVTLVAGLIVAPLAFSWRSLLAGELLVTVAGTTSIGSDLQLDRQFGHPDKVIALMIVILLVGMVVDGIFGYFTKRIRLRRGLTGAI